mgnify:CR=1 FL=1
MRFLTAKQATTTFFELLERKRAKNSRFSASIFRSRAKTARGRPIYIATLNNARGHPETRRSVREDPTNGQFGLKQPRVIH